MARQARDATASTAAAATFASSFSAKRSDAYELSTGEEEQENEDEEDEDEDGAEGTRKRICTLEKMLSELRAELKESENNHASQISAVKDEIEMIK